MHVHVHVHVHAHVHAHVHVHAHAGVADACIGACTMSRNCPFCLTTHSRCSCLKACRRRAVFFSRSASAVLASF